MSTPRASNDDREALLEQRAAARARLLDRLDDEDCSRHANRLRKCGEIIRLKCVDCLAARSARARCDLKWCPSCAPRLAHDRTQRYSAVVETFSAPLFVTFTTRNFDARSRKTTGMREVVRAFRRFRSQRWFRRSVRAGVACFEMTRRAKGWHPHVHVLIDSDWFAATVPRPASSASASDFKNRCRLACTELAEQWTLALGGRNGTVKVRRVVARAGGSVAAALKEVMKYSVTAESLDRMEGKLTLFLDELSVTRNLVAFLGAYRHPALKKTKRDPTPCDCCGAFATMMPADIVEAFERKKRR